MNCKIRPLSQIEIKNLWQLFATEANDSSIYLWQDRQSDFLKIYQPIICDKPRYWGAYVNDELVGTTGLVPLKISSAYDIELVWMDTDLFIKPAFRNKKIGYQLVTERFKESQKINLDRQLYFGIEQTSQQLEICSRLGQSQKIHFLFPRTTELRQEFLTQKLNASDMNLTNEANPIQSCLLSELTEAQIEQWIQSTKKHTFLNFEINKKVIRSLVELDPAALAIFIEKDQILSQGCVLLSQSGGRRFRLTAKNSLVLEKLRRKTGDKLKCGDELKIGVLGLGFGTDHLKTLAPRIQLEAQQRNFHCLSYRTENQDDKAYFSADTIDFQRRIFLIFRHSFPKAKMLLQDLESNKLQIKLDSIFL